ncbi:hypothetical protein [Actinokineospora inagensis]|uniref:hypothetical protein n=1 Tax=Actinokineospora inagensis TaxID=103730 RepID=UPI00047BD594|nr:hypothetical protein [Actinokineospora inagensis]
MVKRLFVGLAAATVTACTSMPAPQAHPVPATTERQCGTVSSIGADGAKLAEGWVVVGQVHQSACAGDYDGLATHMSDFHGGISVDEVVT